MKTIERNLARLRQQIGELARKYQRNPHDIALVAVSKKQPPEALLAARRAGQTEFGENYLQEALAKIEALAGEDCHWHFIGPVQSNKTREVAAHFDWVHTLDRAKVARRLNDHRPEGLAPLSVCIQVNISGEGSKSGIAPAELPALAELVAGLPRLKLRGLMTLPAPTPDPAAQRRPFAELRAAFESLRTAGHDLDTLSMGTTADWQAAVAEGATILRLGTAVFGPRPADG